MYAKCHEEVFGKKAAQGNRYITKLFISLMCDRLNFRVMVLVKNKRRKSHMATGQRKVLAKGTNSVTDGAAVPTSPDRGK
jgi:hypothetical protein